MKRDNDEKQSEQQQGSIDKALLKLALENSVRYLDSVQKPPRDCRRIGFLAGHVPSRSLGELDFRHGAELCFSPNPLVAFNAQGRLISVWRKDMSGRSKYTPHQGARERARRRNYYV